MNAIHHAAQLAAMHAGKGDVLNSNGIIDWVVKNIIPLILLVIGLGVISSARSGRFSDNATVVTNVVIGLGMISGAATLYVFSGRLVDLVFG